MKKEGFSWKALILLGLLILFMLSGCEGYKCSRWNKENCDKSCSVDSDCAQSMCCDCMNQREQCSTVKKLFGFEIIKVHLQCIETTCKCINDQCIDIRDIPPMVAEPYELCDNDRDGDCDKADYELVTQAIGQCEYGENYNELADADHDGCVTESDRQQLFPKIPEK